MKTGFVRVGDAGGSDERFVRTVSDNLWVSVLHRLTGFGWWEWETAICTNEPRTCNIVMGDRRAELETLPEADVLAWYEMHKAEKNSMESILDALKRATAIERGGGRAMMNEMDEKKNDWTPLRLEAVYRIGSGWEVDATFRDGTTSPRLHTSALTKQFAYAPWLDAFTPQEFEDMIGRTLTQMAEAWNEKHATALTPQSSGEEDNS